MKMKFWIAVFKAPQLGFGLPTFVWGEDAQEKRPTPEARKNIRAWVNDPYAPGVREWFVGHRLAAFPWVSVRHDASRYAEDTVVNLFMTMGSGLDSTLTRKDAGWITHDLVVFDAEPPAEVVADLSRRLGNWADHAGLDRSKVQLNIHQFNVTTEEP
jgi:hypothetical protein